MQCSDCKLQGVSCPYTFMFIPDGKIPDPCPYQEPHANSNIINSGYMEVIYPNLDVEEMEKELNKFISNILESSYEVRKLFIKAEAQKLVEWAREKHKNKDITTTLTTTYTVGDEK